MDILTLLLVIPLLTVIAIVLSRNSNQVRISAAIGTGVQFIQTINLIFAYISERNTGNIDEMVFTKSVLWFKTFNIYYSVGVDGISVAMIALTGIVTFAGVLASWKVLNLQKEFFISLIVLSTEHTGPIETGKTLL